MKYNYTRIESQEFELLSKDLISNYLNLDIRVFAKGIDGGIDGLYEKKDDQKVIFQAKHYIASGATALIRNLKNEVEKINLKNPNRYLIITTCNLSVGNVDKIYKMFAPYIKNKQDIIGQLKIDEMIDNNKEILFKYPNLWYNYELIKEILGNEIYQENKEKIDMMKAKQEVFVWCNQYEEVLEKLEHEKVLVITGAPGVGKTTLANLICLKYMYKNYEIINDYSENIDNIKTLINFEKKTLIFSDDFLGANILEYFKNGERLSNNLIDFIKKVQASNNIKLVVTTRTHILNEANQNSDKFNRLYLNKEKRKEIIELDHYTKIEKAKILYNHLKRAILSKKQIVNIKEEKNYRKIINHPNYTPRIIEYITNDDIEDNIKKENYIEYILNLLNNPVDLWDIPFRRLELELKKLLYMIFSFKKEIEINILEEMYTSTFIGSGKEYCFKDTLRILEGSFIKITKFKEKINISFLNPSLRDFFSNKLNSDKLMLKELMNRAVKINQIEYLSEIKAFSTSVIELIIQENYLKKFSTKEQTIFLKNCLKKVKKEELSKKIQAILFKMLEKDVQTLNNYLDIGGLIPLSKENQIKREKNIIELIACNFDEISNIEDIYDLNKVVEIFRKYKLLNMYIEPFKDRTLELLEEIVIDYDYEYNFDETVTHVEYEDIEISTSYYRDKIYDEEFKDLDKDIFSEEEISNIILDKVNSIDLYDRYYKHLKNDYYEYYPDSNNQNSYPDEDNIIDNLFERL